MREATPFEDGFFDEFCGGGGTLGDDFVFAEDVVPGKRSGWVRRGEGNVRRKRRKLMISG